MVDFLVLVGDLSNLLLQPKKQVLLELLGQVLETRLKSTNRMSMWDFCVFLF